MQKLIFDRSSVNAPMARLLSNLGRLASTDLPLLIRGETGVGKELLAREVHAQSSRAAGPFVALNVAAIPANLLEATLFGYVKGAFTGAIRDVEGKFRQAEGGTLFLDEIGDLPLELQVKLLRVLQEKQVEAIGSSSLVQLDFRLVCATHQQLDVLVAKGRFRSDLLFRIDGATLHIPPLRERLSDVAPLAEAFVARIAPHCRLADDAIECLKAHAWPGNVRELEQVIARSLALFDVAVLSAAHIALSSDVNTVEKDDVASTDDTALSEDIDAVGGAKILPLRRAQEQFALDYLRHAIKAYSGDRNAAARGLGISERTFYRLMANARRRDREQARHI